MDIEKIQKYLADHELDGWLMADFHARNTVAMQMLQLSGFLTRRSFFFIPVEGEPLAIVHAIEQDKFANLPGHHIKYSGYKTLEQELEARLSGCKKLAMEYSPMGRLPYIGLVDAGTIELVKSFGIEVVSSADLVASFQARLSAEQIATHRIAAANVIEIKDKAFAFITDSLKDGRSITEFDVMRQILKLFEEYDMETSSFPVCAVDANAGNPHYEPTEKGSASIKKGQLILIDLWGKLKHHRGIYADITWMGFAGSKADIPEKFKGLFDVIAKARDAAIDFVREHIDNQPVFGCDVDDACRKVIDDAGLGQYFTHRTGHSITTTEHGTGPNIDNLEAEDKRKLQQGHLFSIEPGLYMSDCGLRTEVNVLIGHNGAEVTTLPLQAEIMALL